MLSQVQQLTAACIPGSKAGFFSGPPASLSLHHPSEGHVHKSRGDIVVRMWVAVEEMMCVVCVDVTEGK